MVREAARLAGLTLSDEECADLTSSLSSLAKHAEQIDKPTLTNASPLPFHFDPRPPGVTLAAARRRSSDRAGAGRARVRRISKPSPFWPVTHLAHLLRTRKASSVELTTMYLDRLKRYNPQVNCVATLTEERALSEARAADREIAAGQYRGPLHGIPYGVKDIIAAKGYPTRVGRGAARAADVSTTMPPSCSGCTTAGAVLVAKLTTGELAFGDQWAGGRTNNPWNLSRDRADRRRARARRPRPGSSAFRSAPTPADRSSPPPCAAASSACGRRSGA